MDVVICSDSRKPEAKHAILEMYAAHGFRFPDTPVMALHRGRLDLLQAHLDRDPELLTRTFRFTEIFPPEMGCGEFVDTTATPLAGTTLLHMCIEWDELDIARWLLDKGMKPDVRASVDAQGFGGHTPLFHALVSWPHFWVNYHRWGPGRPDTAAFAQLLLDRGADPRITASLRVHIQIQDTKCWHEHRDATPLAWAERYPARIVVSTRAMELVREASR